MHINIQPRYAIKQILLFFLLPLISNAQVITTFAGGGTSLGDGGPATAALINDPGGLVLLESGIWYIASGVDNRVRKIDTNGVITTIAGTGTIGYNGDGGLATAAKLNDPVGIAVDNKGNIFFSDAQNNVIRKINTTSGIITTICGNGTAGYNGDNIQATSAQLNAPDGISFDNKGNLFIADGENNRVRKIDTFGIISTVAGTGTYGFNGDNRPATSAQLFVPTDVTFDSGENMYIADGSNRRVRKVDASGIITTYAGNGNATYSGEGMAATNAQLTAGFIKFDNLGNLYITDPKNYRVYRIDRAGIFHCIAGSGLAANNGDGGPATASGIYYPAGLAFDTCNNAYISNVNYNRIRKISYLKCNYLESEMPTTNIEILLYPNPIANELHVDNVKTVGKYVLLSITETIQRQGLLKEGNNTILLQSLPLGVYILELIDDEGNKMVKKIIKQ